MIPRDLHKPAGYFPQLRQFLIGGVVIFALAFPTMAFAQGKRRKRRSKRNTPTKIRVIKKPAKKKTAAKKTTAAKKKTPAKKTAGVAKSETAAKKDSKSKATAAKKTKAKDE